MNKGIYVALCVVTPPDSPPSPCGGGIDQTGATGASAWVSSNAPSYGAGLATPYGAGGSFSVNISVSAVIADGFDCRQIQCAIVSRNDHTRTADRSQDIFIPVTFDAGQAAPPQTAPPGTTPPETTPPTTIAPPPPPTTTEPAPAPAVELSADGRTGTAGGRSITLSTIEGIDPAGEIITVEGAGFDPATAVQVTLCQAAASPTAPATPCLAGATPDASHVVAPDGTDGPYASYGEGGTFAVELEVAAEIQDPEAGVDCREAACVVAVSRAPLPGEDAAAVATDRTLDLAVPVAFADESPATTTTTTEAEPEPDEEAAVAPVRTEDDGDDGGGLPVIAIVGGLLVVAAAAVVLIVRARSGSAAAPDGPSPEVEEP